MKENIETKDVQRTEYLDKNGLDMLWAKVKENTHNQVEVERNRAVAKENSIIDTKADKSALDNYVLSTTLVEYAKKTDIPEVDTSDFVSKTTTDAQIIKSELTVKDNLRVAHDNTNEWFTNINYDGISVVGNDGHDVYINQNDCIKVSAQIDPYWIYSKMDLNEMYLHGNTNSLRIGLDSIKARRYREHSSNQSDTLFILSEQGVSLYNGDNNHVLTSGGSTIDITQYVLKSVYDEKIAALEARIAALEAKHTETA